MKKIVLLLLCGLFFKIVPWYIIMVFAFIGGIVLATLWIKKTIEGYKETNIERLERIEKKLEKIRKKLEIEVPPTIEPNNTNEVQNNA